MIKKVMKKKNRKITQKKSQTIFESKLKQKKQKKKSNLKAYNKYKGHREQNLRKLFYADFTINLSFSKIIHKIRQSIA